MTLRESYPKHSYFYPELEREMIQVLRRSGLGDLNAEEIAEAFCGGKRGDLRLDNTQDYKDILDEFQSFVSGVGWALKHYAHLSPCPN